MNSVILIGRLARDPELSYTPNTQAAVCRFTIAVDRPKRDGQDQGADFIRITVWGRQAETCDRYLSKGRLISVQGRIQTGSYKNRNGETVYTTDVVADRVEFLGGNTQQQAQPKPDPEVVQKQAEDLFKPCDKCKYGSYTTELGWGCINRQTCDSKNNLFEPKQMESQLGFDDLPDTFMAAEDDIPF